MLHPPFKLITAALPTGGEPGEPTGNSNCCGDLQDEANVPANGRARLADLNTHFLCSIIGTCLSTADLRKLMGRFVDVHGAGDLDVHHDAVRMASQGGPLTKALQKALDHRHGAAIRRLSRAPDLETLGVQWDEALRQGEIPGAYWAVLTHRKATPALRERVFGDVHMLSHLVGAANRADIRRLVALERENAELRERLDRQQIQSQERADERDGLIARLQLALRDAENDRLAAQASVVADASTRARIAEAESATAMVLLQTQRRERAEQSAAAANTEAMQLREQLEHLQQHAVVLGGELAAAENQLRELSGGADAAGRQLERQLRGRRILYVGGRPSSTPTIRELVLRHGGEFQRHDGLEDRKGLLASAVAWAQLVVFPVDCVDHDSVGNLKRLCARHRISYLPLRSAGVGCFAAALSASGTEAGSGAERPAPPICLRHA